MVTTILILALVPLAAQETVDPPASWLAGPDVVEVMPTSQLLKRDFNGTVQRIEGDPFVAAVRTLPLSEEQFQLADAVLIERYQALDEIIGRQYGLLTEAGTIDWDGWGDDPKQNERRITVLTGLFAAFAPFNARGTYVEELRGVLPDDLLDQAEDEARAYYRSLVAEKLHAGGMNPGDGAMQMGPMTQLARTISPENRKRRTEVFREVRLEQFGSMIAESFDRQVGNGDEEKNAFAERLDLDPQQLARIEAIFAPIAIDELQRREIGPMRRIRALGQLWGELKPSQRRILLRDIAKGIAIDGNYRRLPMKR